jgi:hypothetical protein
MVVEACDLGLREDSDSWETLVDFLATKILSLSFLVWLMAMSRGPFPRRSSRCLGQAQIDSGNLDVFSRGQTRRGACKPSWQRA